MTKKIKQTISKKPLSHLPHIALLILAEQRHAITRLMLDWYLDVAQGLAGEVRLSLHLASRPDLEMRALVSALNEARGAEVGLISTTAGAPQGERHNEALAAVKAADADGVICLAPGDLLSAPLLRAQAEQLKKGAVLSGLLDLFLFDPREFKFMHWARHEHTSGVDRVAPVGLLLSRGLLDAVKWRLWPNQEPSSSGFHRDVMARLEPVFSRSPKGSCLVQTMERLEGVALSLKSELARALYEEGDWKRYPGLKFADFEASMEPHMSAEWLDRLASFDERYVLDVLVEEPTGGATSPLSQLWRNHYDFAVYKFLPYADVRLHLFSTREGVAPEGWSRHVVPEGDRGARWGAALAALREGAPGMVLLCGQGGLVDLKTIEHYLIFSFKNGARLLTSQNFYVGDPEQGKLYFWKGIADAPMDQLVGFGTCLHASILDRLSWRPFEGAGPSAALTALVQEPESREQRVMFKCIGHDLGLVHFGLGAVGFEGQMRASDLVETTPTRLNAACFHHSVRAPLERLLSGAPAVAAPLTPTTTPQGSPVSHPTTAPSATSDGLSPLERAKALLAKAQGAAPSPASPAAPAAPAAPAELSPLERAKALLAQSQGATPSAAPAAPAAAPVAAPATPSAQDMIQEAMRDAEALLAGLQARRDALAAEEAARAAQAARPVAVEPALLLCEQGEQAFSEGDMARAEALLLGALQLNPHSVRALSDLGVVATQRNEPWKALSFLLMGLIEDQTDEGVVQNLSALLAGHPELHLVQSFLSR